MKKVQILFPLLFVLLLSACTGTANAQQATRVTGFLEADEVMIAPEAGGRIVALLVDEGDTVAAGQVLARLDDSRIRLQVAQADADVAAAQTRLAQLEAAVRPEAVALAQARLNQAQVAAQAAEQALQDAIQLRDNPQELDVQIAQARAALAEAQAQAQAAQHQAQAADWETQMWGDIVHDLNQKQRVTLPNGQTIEVDAPAEKKQEAHVQWNLASHKAWQAWQQVAQAQAAATQAAVALKDLQAQRDDQQQAQARVVAATNARDSALIGVKQAQAALEALQAGASPEQIKAAQAAVAQAQAAQAAVAVLGKKSVVRAPNAGAVSARYFSSGEVILPGQPLLALLQPQKIHLTIYLPAGLLDQVAVGQRLPLTVESAPQRRYQARVTAIADTPQFTMRQSQNVAERAAVVYAVTLSIEDPDDALRPGLPAEVHIMEGEK